MPVGNQRDVGSEQPIMTTECPSLYHVTVMSCSVSLSLRALVKAAETRTKKFPFVNLGKRLLVLTGCYAALVNGF